MRNQILDTMMCESTAGILVWLHVFYDDFDMVEKIVERLANETRLPSN